MTSTFSTCPTQEPQQHSEVQGVCGCSPVAAGFQIVPVTKVLGMSVSATTFRVYNSNATGVADVLQVPGPGPGEGKGEVLFFSFHF